MHSPIILFDGVCNLCEGVVKFVIKRDKEAVFRFASLQSENGQALLKKHQLDHENFDSFVLAFDENVYVKSEAALKTASFLPFPMNMLRIMLIIPRPIRDAVYSFIARNRYKWFGKKDSCMLPDSSVRKRFLE
ncbi:thiol-disulfide oxidoreductase DCC family protein [Metabacillus sp. KIGAM252]|uniref:Thiol-disulfide oxidoreductase DCC family protein n=1 Tax=Metabacillus flavus TaxID=2823519 RepID=A0ABS5LHS9_9BACI|nr:thiol-disulfide oxidoreductase DCC family protein [Metabacillus flavus]MBS2970314.1 thiol-disulfide oxidoreductase DCC family protein [Metabacillus flavus]